MFHRSKRAGLVAAAVFGIGAVAWGLAGRRPAARFERGPNHNILLVTIDTLRADAISSYGGPARTPNLDALAARGTRFDFAHAHAVLTRPSHASILTGTYPFEHGVRDHSGYRLRPGLPTLAVLLKQQGFETGAFVGAIPLEKRVGLDQGFDEYDDRFSRGGSVPDFSLAERPAGEVVTAATKWIGGRSGRWFAWVHVFDPHAPYTPPPPFDREYVGRPYHGEVAYVDHALAPLFDLAAAASRPTFIIVTSDHGEGLGEHGELTHGLLAYETTLRVPLIMARLDGKSAAGHQADVTSSYPARHVDLLPTVLDVIGTAPAAALPGRSLLPDTVQPQPQDVSSYFEAMSAMLNRGWAPLKGTLAGREKYIDLPIAELYDLAADPGEQSNLADRRADRRRVLAARLNDFRAALPGDRFTEAPEVSARLQALGYISGTAPRKATYTIADDPKKLMELDQWIQQGIEAWQAGRRPEALRIYRRIIDRRPSMPIGYRNLALLQWQNGDSAEAIETLERAFRVAAIEPGMTSQLGAYLAEAGKPRDAIAILEPLTAQAPADPDALNALGIAYARAGDSERSEAVFRRALAEHPASARALENIGTLELERGNLAAAGASLQRAVEADPKSARAHNGLGVVAMRLGRRDEAFTHWRRAVELAPADYDALFNLGMELDAAGRRDEARPYLERFVQQAPAAQYAKDIAAIRKRLGR